MARHVLIIHGWSDTSKSFRVLADFLNTNNYQTSELWLGDYISMDDDVRVADVGKRMSHVIEEKIQNGELPLSFDVIVHSTGGLVAREWLTTHFRGRAQECPMKRLVMLAPANYGSKLAATGKSMLGRIVKGYNNWFQTGQGMLNDLELGSSYQWELAQRDILIAPGTTNNDSYYGEDRVWPFVIVGSHPYNGLLRQIVNEDGGDGTVRVCAANLNTQGITIDFRHNDLAQAITTWGSRLDNFSVPLAVLPTRTHASVVDPLRREKDNQEDIDETPEEREKLGQLILEALACNDFHQYKNLQQAWFEFSETTAERRKTSVKPDYYHQYMQANFEVCDDTGQPINDYFIEFFSNTAKKNDDANVYMHHHVIEDVKINSQNQACRNFYFDRTDLIEGYYSRLPNKDDPILYLSISAASPGKNIQYFANEKIGASMDIPIHCQNDEVIRWLKRNSTHFVKIILPRQPADDVFKLKRYDQAK
jgi:pimeloyl-ACP methyl ester carboxylesterase